MKANASFRYLVNNSTVLDYQSLSQCYAPIMREDATSLYTYLIASFDNGHKTHPITELLNHLQYGLSRLEQALSVLIVLKLVTVYEDKDKYWFKLSPCLSREAFLANGLYRRLLERHIGEPAVAELGVILPHHVKEVTKSFSQVFSTHGDLLETSQETLTFSETFDWESFKLRMSRDGLSFEDEKADMLALYHLADKHGLNWYQTYEVAKQTAISLTISLARMEQQLTNAKSQTIESESDLTAGEKLILAEAKRQSASDFLAENKHLRKALITADEQKLIKTLAEMGFLDEVINIMVLYTFNRTKSANLNQRYLMKLANDFAYQGVQTAELALAKLKQSKRQPQTQGKQASPKTNVPSWSNADYINQTTEEEKRYLEEYKRQALERLNKGEE